MCLQFGKVSDQHLKTTEAYKCYFEENHIFAFLRLVFEIQRIIIEIERIIFKFHRLIFQIHSRLFFELQTFFFLGAEESTVFPKQ